MPRRMLIKLTGRVQTLVLCLLCIIAPPLAAQTHQHRILDGQVLRLSYSTSGATCLKITGGKIKQVLDSQRFDKFLTQCSTCLFLTKITQNEAIFIVFEDDQTLAIELDCPQDSLQITHQIIKDDITLEPQKLGQALLEGQQFSGLERELLKERYESGHFYLTNLIHYRLGKINAQKINILNRSAKVRNLNSFRDNPNCLALATPVQTLNPGESVDVVVVFFAS